MKNTHTEKQGLNLRLIFASFALPGLAVFIAWSLYKEIFSVGEPFFPREGYNLLQRLAMWPRSPLFWLNLIPPIVLFGVGLGLNALIAKFEASFKNAKRASVLTAALVFVSVLIAIEQIVQALASANTDFALTVVSGWLVIRPDLVIGTEALFLNARFFPSPGAHAAVVFLLILFLLYAYAVMQRVYTKKAQLNAAALFWIAGFVGFLCNIAFRNYGYTYLYIWPFEFGLVNIYIYVGAMLALQSDMMNGKISWPVYFKASADVLKDILRIVNRKELSSKAEIR